MKKIPLSQGKVALVDDDMYDYLSQWRWVAARKRGWYARIGGGGVYMHRLITGAPDGMQVDHIDGNGLNNQRDNLRVCTHAENQRNSKIRKDNTTGYKGVQERRGVFTSYISVNGKNKYLGTYKTLEDAARAYDEAARSYFGEYAKLNFIV